MHHPTLVCNVSDSLHSQRIIEIRGSAFSSVKESLNPSYAVKHSVLNNVLYLAISNVLVIEL